MINQVKWYFNVRKWTPTKEEWLRLTSSIAHDELERINGYYFQDNAKSSLIGCALIRKFIADATKSPSNEAIINRTLYGRPEVCQEFRLTKGGSWPAVMDFNVSHQGDFCVLAGVWSQLEHQADIRVGVDVHKIVSKASKPELDNFLELMRRKPFTKAEWNTVESVDDDRQKCINFTRLWCLKESYIKSIGLGLTFKLDRIDFSFSKELRCNLSTELLKSRLLCDASVSLDGQPETSWCFYETALDDEHLVALAYHSKDQSIAYDDKPFKEVTIDLLMRDLRPMRNSNELDWAHFSSRVDRGE